MSDDYDDSRPSTRQGIPSPYSSPKFIRKGQGLGQGPSRENSTNDVGRSMRESSQSIASLKGNYSLKQPQTQTQTHHYQQQQQQQQQQEQVQQQEQQQHHHHHHEQEQEILLDGYMEIAGGQMLTKSGTSNTTSNKSSNILSPMHPFENKPPSHRLVHFTLVF